MVRRADGPIYVFDASAWIDCNGRAGDNRIPVLLDQLFAGKRLHSPKEVFGELQKPGEISEWAKERQRHLSFPHGLPQEYTNNVGDVQWRYPGMGRATGTRRRADPYVVGLARTYDSDQQPWIVVCGEGHEKRPRRKIRGVCYELGIKCVTIEELIEMELGSENEAEE
jgi:hypothetical protein